MGREATTLEATELVVRGGVTARARLHELHDVRVSGERLECVVDGERERLALGNATARRWATAIVTPAPTLARKLGIRATTRLHVTGDVDDDGLREALACATVVTSFDGADLALVRADDGYALERFAGVGRTRRTPSAGVGRYVKGRATPLGEPHVRDTLRAILLRRYEGRLGIGAVDRLTVRATPERRSAIVNAADAGWDGRVARLWATLDEYEPDAFVAEMRSICASRPHGDARAAYELGSAHDSVGRTAEAIPLYRTALTAGLDESYRRQAVIRLASSLRNLGQAHESVALLRAERDAPSDEFDDAVIAFLALALTDVGSAREAVSLTVTALAGRRDRYRRSLTNYAAEFREPSEPTTERARFAPGPTALFAVL